MTRKEFIKSFAALGLATPFLTTLFTSCSQETVDFFEDFDVSFNGKVLVIGAGAAGITAGHILNKQGIDFQILEAAPTHGGRVKKSSNFVDFPIDLGGEWIHTDPSILAVLNNDRQSEIAIDIINYNPQTISVWRNGKLRKRNIASNFYQEYKFKNSTWFDFFDELMIPNIRDKIIYNCPVTAIDYSGQKVMVKTTGNELYEADKILLTVPLKILQNHSIQFFPAFPPEKAAALNEVEMPDGLKVFIEFSEKFYPDILMFDDLLQAVNNSNHTYYDAAFGKASNRQVLGLFTVGEPATRYTSQGSDEAIFNYVINELDEIFDGKASRFYVKHLVQNWSREPFIQGSYSHYDNYDAMDVLSHPIDQKIFFAGEAYATESPATVHGAAESAYAALKRILES
ncbi:MAG: NAD(P)/FAD-dependent oxidoreductase [Bacteroidota bacterium]